MFAFVAQSTAPTAHVWHYWLAVSLAVGGVLLVIALVALYVTQVVRTRFPHRDGA